MTAVDTDFLTHLLAQARERHRVPGAQLALFRAGETWFAGSGHERHGAPAPVSDRSSFPYGSVTKSFTATAVMQLVGDGDIDLDEPIGAYLADLAGAPNGIDRLVTSRQLLSHTSGLPGDFPADGPAPASFRRHALAAGALELVRPPGTGFSYSNVGFVLAGLLLEDVTGMTWWDAVESMLLWPLGAEPTFCVDPRIPPRRRPTVTAHSVSAAAGRTVPVEPLFPTFDGPAGGLAGSAADLVAFGRMHLGLTTAPGRPPLLGAEPLETMRASVDGAVPFGLADGWGLGLARFRAGDVDWFGHDGTFEGTTCHLRFEPRSGTALAVTTNATSGLRLWDDVLTGLHDVGLHVAGYPLQTVATRLAAGVPDCFGAYLNGDARYVVAHGADGVLHMEMDDGVLWHLTCHEGLMFRIQSPVGDEPPVPGRFVPDPDTGEITLMEIGGRVARRCHAVPGGTGAADERIGRRKVSG